MKITKEKFKEYLFLIGKRLNMENTITLIMENYSNSLPEIIKILTYEMFMQNYMHYVEKDNDVYEAISIMREYCNILKRDGEVTFL